MVEMSDKCNRCGSYAINPRSHGRDKGIDLHLCDVCYWRARSNPIANKRIAELEVLLKSLYENKLESDKLYIILSRAETKNLISKGGGDGAK